MHYVQNGFPSKISEALSNATQVLCNILSDLADYLKEEYNTVICDEHSPVSINEALKRALELTSAEKHQTSFNAIETAKTRFDYRGSVG